MNSINGYPFYTHINWFGTANAYISVKLNSFLIYYQAALTVQTQFIWVKIRSLLNSFLKLANNNEQTKKKTKASVIALGHRTYSRNLERNQYGVNYRTRNSKRNRNVSSQETIGMKRRSPLVVCRPNLGITIGRRSC